MTSKLGVDTDPALRLTDNPDLPLASLDPEKLRHDCALASCARSRQTAKMPR